MGQSRAGSILAGGSLHEKTAAITNGLAQGLAGLLSGTRASSVEKSKASGRLSKSKNGARPKSAMNRPKIQQADLRVFTCHQNRYPDEDSCAQSFYNPEGRVIIRNIKLPDVEIDKENTFTVKEIFVSFISAKGCTISL